MGMNSPTTLKQQRPLSPHLQVYRWQISMTLSILHRATGVALSVGAILLALWLWSVAYGGPLSEYLFQFFSSILGQMFLIGWSASLYYHLGNGIRHLVWDAGYGFELNTMEKSGWAVVLFTILATAGSWCYVYGVI